jgi:nucleotide-binding universal stress UspA family protein
MDTILLATDGSEYARRAAERGVPVEGVTRHGVPHEVIFEYAGEVDADVIVIGEHGDHADHFAGVGRRVRERAGRAVVVVGAGSTVAPRP